MKSTIPVLLILLALFILMTRCSFPVSTFYVDSQLGNDANKGTLKKPLKSIEKINSLRLQAGNSVFFAGGQTFYGTLRLSKLAGTKAQPIVIGSYRNGRAILNGENGNAIRADSCSWLRVKNLSVTGNGRLAGNAGSGIEFRNNNYCMIDSIETSGFFWSGVKVVGGKNLRITHVYAHDNGFSGINVESDGKDAGGLEGSGGKTFHNLYIGGCVAENNPGCPAVKDNHSGNGILIGGVTNGIIEHCEAMKNGWDMPREGNGPVGIWAYQCDSVTIQYCYSHDNKTSPKGKDGGGFDFDGGITNSVMQYNLSANNEGAGYGMFQYYGASDWENNIVRYNISYNDGAKNGKCGIFMWCDPSAIPMRLLHAYNNTIVNNQGYGVNFEPGNYPGFVFENNIFLLTATSDRFTGGSFKGASFNQNLFWAKLPAQPSVKPDTQAISADPLMILTDNNSLLINNKDEMSQMTFFQLRPESPALKAGKPIENNGGKDFWQNQLSKDEKPNIGAFGK